MPVVYITQIPNVSLNSLSLSLSLSVTHDLHYFTVFSAPSSTHFPAQVSLLHTSTQRITRKLGSLVVNSNERRTEDDDQVQDEVGWFSRASSIGFFPVCTFLAC